MPCAWSRECWFLRLGNATSFVCNSEPKYWTNTNKQKAVDPCRQWNVTRFDRGHHCQKKDRKLDTQPMVSTSSVLTIIALDHLIFQGVSISMAWCCAKGHNTSVCPRLSSCLWHYGPAISKSSAIEYVQEWGCSLQPSPFPLSNGPRPPSPESGGMCAIFEGLHDKDHLLYAWRGISSFFLCFLKSMGWCKAHWYFAIFWICFDFNVLITIYYNDIILIYIYNYIYNDILWWFITFMYDWAFDFNLEKAEQS